MVTTMDCQPMATGLSFTLNPQTCSSAASPKPLPVTGTIACNEVNRRLKSIHG